MSIRKLLAAAGAEFRVAHASFSPVGHWRAYLMAVQHHGRGPQLLRIRHVNIFASLIPMKYKLISAAALFICSFTLENEISVSSTHMLVSNNLVLGFELRYSGNESEIFRFKNISTGLSPNECSQIILYDKEMNEIYYAVLIFGHSFVRPDINPYMKLFPGSIIRFSCKADTAEFRYLRKDNLPHRKVQFKNIRFYKMVYEGPPNGPRNSIKKFESPLFSLL